MDRERLRRPIGFAMVALGLLQAGLGVRSGEPVYAGLGVAYAAIAVAWLYYET